MESAGQEESWQSDVLSATHARRFEAERLDRDSVAVSLCFAERWLVSALWHYLV